MNLDEPPASDNLRPAGGTTFYGARWSAILGLALLFAFGALTAVRWFGPAAVSAEQIVQIPVPAAIVTPTPRPEVLAPDPGDTP